MRPPTSQEIEAAYRAINDAGPMHADTLALSGLTYDNPRLSLVNCRLREAYAELLGLSPIDAAMLRPAVVSAIMTGLNYGLRIGDARAAALDQAARAVLHLCLSLLASRAGATDDLIHEVVNALSAALGLSEVSQNSGALNE